MMGKPSERGAALLAVLAMVMLLAAFASLGLSRLRAATDRITTSEALSEAHLVADAGISAALTLIGPLKAQANRRPGMLERPIILPVGDNRVTLRFSDGGACFNLNSLLPRSDSPVAESSVRDFARLLAAAGIATQEADSLAKATADMLAARRLLWADASEWVTVPGVTRAHWAAAGPLLCALPNREAAALNINSLTADKAPLLVAMGLQPDEARRALANRPAEGWSSAGSFWSEAVSSGVPDSAAAEVVGTTSRWINLRLIAETPGLVVERQLLLDTLRPPARIAASVWRPIRERSA